MVRRLAVVVVAALALPLAAWANPSDVDLRNYRTKLSQFLGERMSRDKAVTVLKGWFGRDFEARRDDVCACWDYAVVVRKADGTIIYYQTIGTATDKEPHQLLLERE